MNAWRPNDTICFKKQINIQHVAANNIAEWAECDCFCAECEKSDGLILKNH